MDRNDEYYTQLGVTQAVVEEMMKDPVLTSDALISHLRNKAIMVDMDAKRTLSINRFLSFRTPEGKVEGKFIWCGVARIFKKNTKQAKVRDIWMDHEIDFAVRTLEDALRFGPGPSASYQTQYGEHVEVILMDDELEELEEINPSIGKYRLNKKEKDDDRKK